MFKKIKMAVLRLKRERRSSLGLGYLSLPMTPRKTLKPIPLSSYSLGAGARNVHALPKVTQLASGEQPRCSPRDEEVRGESYPRSRW